MKKFAFIFLLLGFCTSGLHAQVSETISISRQDIAYGYYVKKIWLQHYAAPRVQLSGLSYEPVPFLPRDAKPGTGADVQVVLGKELKKPFALIRVPAYRLLDDGSPARLSSFSLAYTEAPAPAAGPNAAALSRTTSSSSVLATGTWYKISVPRRGMYQIDYDFIKNTLGVNPAGINPHHIRIYGNGGAMLSENNAVPRPDDLVENAIWVTGAGDNAFNPGDQVIFFANGPMDWQPDSLNRRFLHRKHLYADSSYYFINFDQGSGLRVATQPATGAPTVTVTAFDDYTVHENDEVNLGKFGKDWWGDAMGTGLGMQPSRTFNFDLGPALDSVHIRYRIGSRSTASTNIFTPWVNGQQQQPIVFGGIIEGDGQNPVIDNHQSLKIPASPQLSIRFDYQPGITDGKAYLDYIEVNYRRQLSLTAPQLAFRDWRSVGQGQVASYQLQQANAQLQVWDITNPLKPLRMQGALNGSTWTFSQDASRLREFIAFDGSQYLKPAYAGPVANQNLHGQGPADMVIVTHPRFKEASDRLADFHRQRSGLRVTVTPLHQIYNEFSSGSQDISAIRDYVKMFYDRAGTNTADMPRYLLLMGDASYDYKDRIGNNSNLVPTFESAQSVIADAGFCNDDFFGFLDDNEDIENWQIANTLDVGVGRLPVHTAEEARDVVDKIMYYKSPATLGPWRLNNTYVGDNEDDAGFHMTDAETMVRTVAARTPLYNNAKVYLDALPYVSTPGGARCPDANKAISNQIYKGTFMINYTGHGNTLVLAHERVLTQDDFNGWKNLDKMPFMITATCDFGRFDHPEYVSSGEKLILKKDGGAIAMITTTQLVYAGANAAIDSQFLSAQYDHSGGAWHTFGDAFRIAKNRTYQSIPDVGTLINFRKFSLLADPALEPNFPEHAIHTDSLTELTTGLPADTIKALGAYQISGHVASQGGQLLSSFNGQLYVTIYDKPQTVKLQTKEYNMQRSFEVQNNIVYKGKATVQNGRFTFSFIAPKDLNYEFGQGRISYYADNGITDAAGSDPSFAVGGFSDHPVVDDMPPIVKPYIGDSLFRDGGITGSNTLLYVALSDETGINISGNGVGHDLTAVLDGNIQQPMILNDHYETAPNDYRRGYVSFPLSGLADGPHSIRVKAWDVNNNSGEGVVHFVVVNGKVVQIDKLGNYPNPFTDETRFIFEHNHPGEELRVQIHIYSISGSLVRVLDQQFEPGGSRSNEISWDGTAQNGAKLPAGVYVYRMSLSTSKGVEAMAYQKLVLIR